MPNIEPPCGCKKKKKRLSLLSIDVASGYAPRALGQVPSQATGLGVDYCSLVPTHIPIVSDIIAKFGCLPAGRALAAAQIAQAATPTDTRTPADRAAGVPPPMTPVWGQVLAIVGPEMLVECVCKKTNIPGGYYGPPPVLWYQNPMILGLLAVAGVGLVVLLAKRDSRPAAPPVAPPAAPAPVAPSK